MYDNVTGTFGGTKEADQASVEDVEIAYSPDARIGAFQRSLTYSAWEIQALCFDYGHTMQHYLSIHSYMLNQDQSEGTR